MSVEILMKMKLSQVDALERMLKTFDRFGMMLPYLVMVGTRVDYPDYVVVRIVDKMIYKIEVDE